MIKLINILNEIRWEFPSKKLSKYVPFEVYRAYKMPEGKSEAHWAQYSLINTDDIDKLKTLYIALEQLNPVLKKFPGSGNVLFRIMGILSRYTIEDIVWFERGRGALDYNVYDRKKLEKIEKKFKTDLSGWSPRPELIDQIWQWMIKKDMVT